MKTIAISTYKGGVGKTTTTRDLSAALARSGHRVLALDLDRTQRHLMGFAAGVPGVDFKAMTAGRLTKVLLRAEEKYDFALIDCPPTLAKEAATALRLADVVISPAAPEYLAADGLERVRQAVDLARYGNENLKLCVLITMFDTRDPSCAVVASAIRGRFRNDVFAETIKRQPAFNAAALGGVSVFEQNPRSQGAQVYKKLAEKISSSSATPSSSSRTRGSSTLQSGFPITAFGNDDNRGSGVSPVDNKTPAGRRSHVAKKVRHGS